MENPSGIRIIVQSPNDSESIIFNTLVENAEQISIRFYLKSPDGVDKVLVQVLVEDTSLKIAMEDKLENVLSEAEFNIQEGQLVMELTRPGYKEELEEKILANL